MKKGMKKGVKITLITIASLLLVAMVGLFVFDIVLQNIGKRDSALLPYENIALSSKLSADSDELGLKNLIDGRSSTYSAFKKEHTIYMEFDGEKTFNTIVIKEDMQVMTNPVCLGGSLQDFKISQKNKAGEWEMFYKNDGVCDYRYIAFDSVTTSKLKFEFKNETKFISLKEIEVYNTPAKPDNKLRVNEYLVMRYDQVANAKQLEKLKGYSGVITDLTLMANAYLDSKGKIMYYLGDEHRADFEKTVNQVMAFAKTYHMRVYLNIFSNYVEESDYMMRDCASTIADTALQMCLTYGFDGIDIDWEYPRNKEQLGQYNNLLVKIKEKLAPHNKKIALSTGAWNVGFSDEAWQAIDHVAVMVYDQMSADRRGNHASFFSAVKEIETMREKGCPMEKLELGLPFYGKVPSAPYNNARYCDIDAPDKFANFANATVTDSDGNSVTKMVGYNGYQMIFDKTAFAIELGLGGIMTWTVSDDKEYDNPLSLHRAIATAIEARGGGHK